MEASNCDNLPSNTWEDTAKNKWRLGQLMREGGFEVYLVSSNIYEIVNAYSQVRE
jgi:hypothetical protein